MKSALLRGYTSGLACLAMVVGFGAPAAADTIDPASFAATVDVGGSVTVRKTVTVTEAPAGGVIDVAFVFDTSGSMGPFIAGAKVAANDILAGLATFGDLATSTGFYSEPGNDGTFTALTTNTTQQLADINSISLGLGGGGGDFPEEGIAATFDAAENTAWRPGSSRFIIALGDATFKESDGVTTAMAQAALGDNNVTFIGINFNNMTNTGFGGISPQVLADASGGSIFLATADPDSIVDAILDSVSEAFSEYNSVTVSDLGAGLPGVGMSVTCVSADGVACSGSTATGTWTREEDRVFEFDVTFTGLAPGVHSFPTRALVDGAIAATESDRITVGVAPPVPEPTLLSLLGLAVGAGALRRLRRTAKAA